MIEIKKLTAYEELQVEVEVQKLLPFLYSLQLDTESAWALAHNVATVFYGAIHSCSNPKELLSAYSLQDIGDAFERILYQDQHPWEEEFAQEVKDVVTP